MTNNNAKYRSCTTVLFQFMFENVREHMFQATENVNSKTKIHYSNCITNNVLTVFIILQ